MARPDITIIIVNWKVRALVEKCLDSIITHDEGVNLEIFVVDNDSRDGVAEMIMMEYPDVKMIALPHNIGFGAANNLAIKQARGRYLCLLNPDTRVTANFFPTMINYMDQHPEVGMAGPKILNPDESLQLSVRRFPDLLSQILILLKLKNILVNNKFLSRYLFGDFDYTKEQAVEQIMGAAMIVRRQVIDKIGMFDEKFFVWFEEVDFCKRVLAGGFQIKYFPEAKVIHYGGASFNKRTVLRKQINFNQN